MIVDYIDEHKQEYGVEPICRELTAHGCKIAPSTHYDPCAAGNRLDRCPL